MANWVRRIPLANGRHRAATLADMNNSLQQHLDYAPPTNSSSHSGSKQRGHDEKALLITVDEAARLLGCGRSFAYNLVLSGELVTVKLGRLRRVPVGAVHQYIANRLASAA